MACSDRSKHAVSRAAERGRRSFSAATFATRAAECGMDGRALAEILGHGSPAFTFARYVHPLASYKADMMERLAARIRPCAGSVRVRAHSPFGDAECAVPVLCD